MSHFQRKPGFVPHAVRPHVCVLMRVRKTAHFLVEAMLLMCVVRHAFMATRSSRFRVTWT